MGVAIKEILTFKTINKTKLNNKKIAFDTFNMLYQFLASIRQPNGEPLKNSKGEVTSHLKGLFNRLIYFKKNNINCVFVFDGEAPKLKEQERANRLEKKLEADKKYKEALDLGLTKEAKKFSQGTSRLDKKMIEEAKKLIDFFGFPIIQAPSEGEAQASFLTKKGLVFAISSQDFDSLLFGAKYLIRNLSIGTKRKIIGTSIYKDIDIEFYDLKENLENLNLTQDQLIILAILCGTDFNPKGIPRIGPKKALILVKQYNEKFDELFKILDWHNYFSYPWINVFNTIKKMKINEDIEKLNFKKIDKKNIKKFLVDEADFDEKLVLKRLSSVKEIKSLNSFF